DHLVGPDEIGDCCACAASGHAAAAAPTVASNTASARAVIQNCIIAFNGTQGTANTGGVNVQGNGDGQRPAGHRHPAPEQCELWRAGHRQRQLCGVHTFSTVVPTGIVSVNSSNLISVGPSNAYGSVTGTLTPSAFQ